MQMPHDKITLDRSVVATLFSEAAAAAWLAGQLEPHHSCDLIDALSGYIDAIAHKLCELLGTPSLPAAAQWTVAAPPVVIDAGDAP